MGRTKLKAPFPAFGGKSKVADLVWSRIGDVDNAIEPFANSAAWLLARPHPPRIETLNDADMYISNFWRSTKYNPEAVVEWADWPVNECDLHSNHRWLVLGDYAAEFRQRMKTDPEFYDPKVAGRWVGGLCAWIGSGWCATNDSAEWEQKPTLTNNGEGQGVHGDAKNINGPIGGSGERSPILGGGEGQYGHGIHAKGEPPQKRPRIHGGQGADPPGVHSGMLALTQGRPQLADAYDVGRGVHSTPPAGLSQAMPMIGGGEKQFGQGVHRNPEAGTCAERRAWLLDWFGRLRDRLRTVRVCCGDFMRVMESESVTTRLGVTGIFADPPYPHTKKDGTNSRNPNLYAVDADPDAIRDRLLAYCLERGDNPKMRIAVCCYEGDGYEVLIEKGWDCIAWRSSGGYGNRSAKGKENAGRERIFFSPHCQRQASLLDALEDYTLPVQ